MKQEYTPYSLSPDQGPYVAIIDPSNDPEMLRRIEKLPTSKRCCLWRGDLGKQLASVAPYLVQLIPNSVFGRWFLGAGEGIKTSLICASTAGLEALNAHFRRLILVNAHPLGSALHYRFYDPHVWHNHLEVIHREKQMELFGPVERFYLCTSDGQAHVWARSEIGKLQHHTGREAWNAVYAST